jgi:hypothetical protein
MSFSKLLTLAFVFIVALSTGCATTSTGIKTLQPAAFVVPDHINTIATINRSVPAKKFASTVEAIATGETIMQDRNGANNAIKGLAEGLMHTPRFVVKYTTIETENRDGFSMPMPMDWNEIEKICQAYSVDAVAALEAFDSDTFNNTTTETTNTKSKDGRDIKTVTFNAQLNAKVRLGWRLYDPKTKKIIDEFMVDELLTWNGDGKTEIEALANLPDQRMAVDKVSFAGGAKYASRIAPTWATINRQYYKGGNDQMKNATRKTKINKWKDAAAVWQPLTKSSDKKIAGRAAYNMAVACEVEGKLELARDWAKEAYEQDGNKKARTYYNQLKSRIAAQKVVDKQMGGVVKQRKD